MSGTIDRDRDRPGHMRDAEFVEADRVADPRQRQFDVRLEHGLGERRPLIGRMRLVADERDRTGMADLAQAHRRARAGLPGADDHDSPLPPPPGGGEGPPNTVAAAPMAPQAIRTKTRPPSTLTG